MLVISRYALDYQPYNSKSTDVTWQTCSLRTWLNETFLNDAFTPDEQAMIQNTAVTNDNNPKFGTSAGNDTKDKVFLLSINEAKKNLHISLICKGTRYCDWRMESLGGRYYDGNALSSDVDFDWWLRSPGSKSSNAAIVTIYGSVSDRGSGVGAHEAVRPAMWVNLGS